MRGLIAEGADCFLLGGYGGFDSLVAHTVHELKRQYPEIHSTLVIPYLNREYSTELYDDTTYPPLEDVPMKFAISKRNEWMVDQADAVVAYVTHGWGGAAATLQYAEREKQKDYQGIIGFLSRRFVTEHRLRGVFFLDSHVTKSLPHAVVLDFLFQTP